MISRQNKKISRRPVKPPLRTGASIILVLDTATLPVVERAEAYYAIAVGESGSCSIEQETYDDRLWKRLEVWHFGPVTMFATEGSDMRIRRTPKHARFDSRNTVSVISQSTRPADIERLDGMRVLVLHPPRGNSGWLNGRTYEHMESQLDLDGELTPAETRDWLARVAPARETDLMGMNP